MERLDTASDADALTRADRVREPDELGAEAARFARAAVLPLDRPFAPGPAQRGDARLAGRTDTSDVHLVGRVERVGRVPGQHVGETRRERAADNHGHALLLRERVEGEQPGQASGVVAHRGDGHARHRRAVRVRDRRVAGDGEGHRVHARRERPVRDDGAAQRVGELPGPVGVAGRDEEPLETGGVDELAAGAHADGAGPDQQDGRHRKSGPSSSRQPPLVGGTLPLPRRRTTIPASRAQSTTSAKRRKFLIVGLGGIEPPTSPLSGVRSNRLSYSPKDGSRYSAGPSSFTVISTPPNSSAKML